MEWTRALVRGMLFVNKMNDLLDYLLKSHLLHYFQHYELIIIFLDFQFKYEIRYKEKSAR